MTLTMGNPPTDYRSVKKALDRNRRAGTILVVLDVAMLMWVVLT
jgi:hypothetical protein